MINDTLLTAVENELRRGPWRLRFADEVEARFEEDTQRQRSRSMVMAGLISAIIYCLFLINDHSFRPDTFATALALRVGVMLPFGMPILWWVYRGVSPAQRETLMASTVIVATVISCLILVESTVPYSYLDVFSFGLILLVGNIVYSLRFNYACVSSAICIFIILLFVLSYDPMPPEAKRLAIFTIIAQTLFTLVANYRFEQSERTSYLHVLKEKLRAGYYLKDNQELSRMSVTDPLTNLANRRQFDTVFPVRWQEATDKGLCLGLMVIDIDHFKAYNDYYGHPQGDECLRQVATAMQANSRDADLVVRFGGEEFVVLIANASPEAAKPAAERIRCNVEALEIPNHGVSAQSVVTVSVGVAVLYPKVSLAPAELLSQADDALYEAKRQGRNRVWVASAIDSSSGDNAIDGLSVSA
ncbi:MULTISPECIES: GGDEF domain-containing protein [Halomonadaceae]|jgi:diguanylate cyclase (GGDEF)-like protein|uniref:GGDEF domain-containing protein n=1 Tax=Halomonadaceae TaxID=28256 RepID=UPI0012EF3F6B|nr:MULTISPECIES: diguanylate cyclase [Halomonas]UEQ03420.1 diguanylate cyclase [Halomonas profundus]CAD5257906.1 Diguanylate cyclase [Halomonas sp. 59]CAD5258134.1 Diguanylate cyclase [Halomonas sp. 113]CAD5272048.1 Diguanylate cyclase [Halomonas sp. I3]CAD5290563.1 Diguanylate cyclase [Halomonas sp. 156]